MNKVTPKRNTGKAATVARAKPQALLVMGMHRSGTSACTRVLNLLGCSLSDNLLGRAEGNESGHWKSVEVVALNDKILESAGSSHDDWGPLNADWRQSAIRAQMVSQARDIVTDHTKIGPLFAIKDPRICRLADVWLEAVANAGAEPLVLLMIRNPVEVSASLEERDLMARGYGELLWLRYILDAERFSRGQKRVVCRYDVLMSNWQELIGKIATELGVFFPRNSPKIHAEIDQYLSPDQRHHIVDNASVIEGPSHSDWLRTAFKVMLGWSDHGEKEADYQVLDRIRAELDRAHDTFARLLLTSKLEGATGSGGRLRQELATVRAEAESHEEALRVSAARIDTESTRTQSLQSEIERLRAEFTVQTAAADNQIREASREVQNQKLQNAELSGQLSALQSALAQRQEELAQFLREFKETEKSNLAAEAELEKERRQRNELKNRLDSADIEAKNLKARLEKANDSHARKVESLTADLVNVTSLLQQQEDAALCNAEWLNDIFRLEESFPKWWSVMPQAWQMRRRHRRLSWAGLFDADAYIASYPDVAEERMDPLRHYILHGIAEGRIRPEPS